MSIDISKLFDVTYFPGSDILIQKLFCREHKEVVVDLPTKASKNLTEIEMKALQAHLELRHGVRVHVTQCQDPKCRIIH